MFEINNLHVSVNGREILRGITLAIGEGEVHVIMGPNGSGKSTLSYVIAGRDGYQVTAGSVYFKGLDLLAMSPEDRALAGVFLSFQYPLEIAGVRMSNFLRTALNAHRKHRGESEIDPLRFSKLLRDKALELGITDEMLKRPLNVGFSGGERKRNEVLQMVLLEPTLSVMDEIDSGLDIDALKVVANGINALRSPERSFLVITHYQRLLDYVLPDRIHILSDGWIVRSGSRELAKKLEATGYTGLVPNLT
jgi:Fe-S cluster assembly ATP-binding protein